jgi:hypothetical protein
MATLTERLEEFIRRLGNSPRAKSADEALEQISATLEEVEDELSGIPKKSPPPPPNMPDGRMYPPLADFTIRHADGRVTAQTRGHIIEVGADGGIAIKNKRTGAVDVTKGGTGP